MLNISYQNSKGVSGSIRTKMEVIIIVMKKAAMMYFNSAGILISIFRLFLLPHEALSPVSHLQTR